MNLGEKIYNLRKEKSMSQEDLANILNVSRQTISKWETGESNPDIDKIVPLCNYFKITTDEFLKGETISNKKKITLEKKNRALILSLCLIIFGIMISLVMILEDFEISEGIIGTIIMLGLTLIGVLLIYYFLATPNNKSINKEQNRIVHKIFILITLIIYLVISFLWNAWAYTWIIFIIEELINQVVKLLLKLGEKNEK